MRDHTFALSIREIISKNMIKASNTICYPLKKLILYLRPTASVKMVRSYSVLYFYNTGTLS